MTDSPCYRVERTWRLASTAGPCSPVPPRSVPFGSAEHGLGIDDAKAIGAAEPLRDPGCKAVRLAACPIALELEDVLERRHRAGTSLDHPFHCTLMGFGRDVATGVRDHIDLESLIQRRQ